MKFLILVFLGVLYLSAPTIAKKKANKDLYCDVCKAIVEEVEYEISKVDPNKMIDVGSYRVDPDGKTRTVKRSYARSESHITDLMEKICGEISDNYIESKDIETGKKRIRRIVTRDGKMSGDVDFNALMEDSQKNPDVPPDSKSKGIKFACEKIIEESEEDFLEQFQNGDVEDAKSICVSVAGYCKTKKSKVEL